MSANMCEICDKNKDKLYCLVLKVKKPTNKLLIQQNIVIVNIQIYLCACYSVGVGSKGNTGTVLGTVLGRAIGTAILRVLVSRIIDVLPHSQTCLASNDAPVHCCSQEQWGSHLVSSTAKENIAHIQTPATLQFVKEQSKH